ncbi:MAG: hypothetical protein Q9212_002808 [Teloschistes hypoglaucus]
MVRDDVLKFFSLASEYHELAKPRKQPDRHYMVLLFTLEHVPRLRARATGKHIDSHFHHITLETDNPQSPLSDEDHCLALLHCPSATALANGLSNQIRVIDRAHDILTHLHREYLNSGKVYAPSIPRIFANKVILPFAVGLRYSLDGLSIGNEEFPQARLDQGEPSNESSNDPRDSGGSISSPQGWLDASGSDSTERPHLVREASKSHDH